MLVSPLDAQDDLNRHKNLGTTSTQNANVARSQSLEPLLDWAEKGRAQIRDTIQDYTCMMVKRERVDGVLLPYECFTAKVRHEQTESGHVTVPFSIYLKFLQPSNIEGREVLFVQGQNKDRILVRNGGRFLASLTTSLDPKCRLAMSGNRYPITEFGIHRLIERLIESGKAESKYGECNVEIATNVNMKEHVYTRIEVKHPVERPYFQNSLTRIYVDEQHHLPIRFEAYDWPETADGDPVLREEYTYQNGFWRLIQRPMS